MSYPYPIYRRCDCGKIISSNIHGMGRCPPGTDRPVTPVQAAKAVPTDFTDIFKSGKFSDCQVKCGDRVWNLHKLVICPRSKFFAAALDGPFVETAASEVTLEEQDPNILDLVLQYLYSGNLSHIDPELINPQKNPGNDLAHVINQYELLTSFYILVDFLDLQPPGDDILGRMQKINNQLALSVRNNGGAVMKNTGDFTKRFVKCINKAYSLPSPLKFDTNASSSGQEAGQGSASTSRNAPDDSRTDMDTIRGVYMGFLLAVGPRNVAAVLSALETFNPGVLVDFLMCSHKFIMKNDSSWLMGLI